ALWGARRGPTARWEAASSAPDCEANVETLMASSRASFIEKPSSDVSTSTATEEVLVCVRTYDVNMRRALRSLNCTRVVPALAKAASALDRGRTGLRLRASKISRFPSAQRGVGKASQCKETSTCMRKAF